MSDSEREKNALKHTCILLVAFNAVAEKKKAKTTLFKDVSI